MAKPISTRRRASGRQRPSCRASRIDRNTVPPAGSITPAPSWDLAKARSKLASRPITSPVDFISGPRMVSTFGKRANGNTASFTATCGAIASSSRWKSASLCAGHHPGADLGHRHAGCLGNERHGAGGARVHLQHVDHVVLDGVLHVHQADDAERLGHRLGLAPSARSPWRATACRAAASRRSRRNGCRLPRYAP